MAQVCLLQSFAGNDFSYTPGQLIECSDEEAERMKEAGAARDLLTSEPTEAQTASMVSLYEPAPGNTTPPKKRTPKAKAT